MRPLRRDGLLRALVSGLAFYVCVGAVDLESALPWHLWALGLSAFAVAGMIAGLLAFAASSLAVSRKWIAGPGRAAALLAALPLVLVYTVTEFNRLVLLDHNFRATSSVIATFILVLCLIGLTLAMIRQLDRSVPSTRRPIPTVLRAALGGVILLSSGSLGVLTRTNAVQVRSHGIADLERPPNVVIFVSDCLREDHTVPGGYPLATTPVLARMAREGVWFADAHAVASWTFPSVVGMMTSQRAGIEVTPDALAASLTATTLPELLEAHGYATYAASNNPHIVGPFGIRHRFGGFDDASSPIERALYRTVLDQIRIRLFRPDDSDVVDRVLDVLDRLPEPFLVYVHLMSGHSPYELPRGYEAPFPIPFAEEEISGPHRGMTISGEARVNMIARYDVLVRHADDQFGRIVDALEVTRRLDHTLLIYTADHGEEFGEHGDWTHGQSLHDETVHVPLAARLPGAIPAGVVRSDVVSLMDLAPTVLAMVGGGAIDMPHSFRGEDLHMESESTPDRERLVIAELGPSTRSLITPVWKYIVSLESGEEQLFDRRSDPGERIDVSASHTTDLEEMRRHLAARLATERPSAHPSSAPVSEDIVDQLRALGYVSEPVVDDASSRPVD
jgi:arylsulfatase A-like enzyme